VDEETSQIMGKRSLRCRYRAIVILPLMLVVSGCATVIPLIASGITGGAGYSLLNTAHKTETYSSQTVYRASLQALQIMELPVQHVSGESTRAREIEAAANERRITISIEEITTKATKLTVNVQKGGVLKDKATAEEIIRQTQRVLAATATLKKARASLVVNAEPANVRVRIMNIRPRFYQGILLTSGSYHIRINAPDDESSKGTNHWITLNPGEDKVLSVALEAHTNS